MAGFVGILGKKSDSNSKSIKRALELTKYASKITVEENVINLNHFSLGRSYFDFIADKKFSAEQDRIHCWVDGEVFNNEELTGGLKDSFAMKLLQAYKTGSLNTVLRDADGVFIAIIYDDLKRKALLISDRYGLKPFYIYHKSGNLIFAPELKCFPCFDSFQLSIRKDLVKCFIDLGHFMGTTTWFDQVNLIKPASIYVYDLDADQLKQTYYWTWANIKKESNLTLTQAAELLAEKFKKAVRSRSEVNGRLGISLSGGYDSRAILAAIYKDMEVDTFTFGLAGSGDVRIAAQVANKAGVRNVHYSIDGDDWLSARFEGVWKTDGLLNMRHLHYSNTMHKIENLIDVNLSGFIGDVVFGGSYLTSKKKSFINKKITNEIARHYYGEHFEFADPQDPFYNIDTVDAYFINNRGRRVPGLGLEEPNKTIPQRIPFLEKQLMEAVYSLTDDYRINRKVYDHTLLILSPELFGDIPHVTSGVPLSDHFNLYYFGKRFVKKYSDKLKAFRGLPISFADYNAWIRRKDSALLISSVLDSKQALYRNYVDQDFVKEFLEPHLSGKGFYSDKILAAVTIEIWLQQVLNGKYMLNEPNRKLSNADL